MKPTDTGDLGLGRLIVRHLAGASEHPPVASNTVQELVSSHERAARGVLPGNKGGDADGEES